MKYILTFQWDASSIDDYHAMLAIEEALRESLRFAEVDGHDAGSGEMNIFIYTDDPARTFEDAKPTLESFGSLTGVRVAYREAEGEEYHILWPDDLAEFSII